MTSPDQNAALGSSEQLVSGGFEFGAESEIGKREIDEDSYFAGGKGKPIKIRLAEGARVSDEYNKAKRAGSVVPQELETKINALSPDDSEAKNAAEQIFERGVDSLFILADGAGGMGGGDRASQITVKEVLKSLAQTSDWKTLTPDQRKEAIKNAVVTANAIVYNTAQAEHNRMMSTLTMAMVIDGEVYVANVGDSRTYIQDKKGTLVQISKDQSEAQRMVNQGLLKEEDKPFYPRRNFIDRSVGGEQNINVDVFDPVQISGKAKLLLCCDGLWESIPNKDELSQVLASQGMTPEQIAAALIQKAQENIANGNETDDNITAVVADLDIDKTTQPITPTTPLVPPAPALPSYGSPSAPPPAPPAPPRPVPIPPAAPLPPLVNYSPVQLHPIPPQPMPRVGSKEWVEQSLNNFGDSLKGAIDKVANKLKRQPAAARRQASDSGQQLNEILTSWGETLLEREKRRQAQPATGAVRAGQVAGDILLGATAFGISGAGKEAAKILLGPSGLAIAAVGGGLQSAVRGVGELTRNGGLETAMQRKDAKGLNLFGRYADVETWGARGAVRIVDILQRRSDSLAEKQDRDELLAIIHGSGSEFSTFVGPDRDFNPDNLIKALDFIDQQPLTADEKLQYKARLSAQAVRTLGRSSQIGYADIDSSKAAELDKFLTEALTHAGTFVEQFQKGTVEQKQQANELIAVMAESRRSRGNLLALEASYLAARTTLGAAKAIAVFEIAQGVMGFFRGTSVPSPIRPPVVGATQPEQPYPPGFEKGFKMPTEFTHKVVHGETLGGVIKTEFKVPSSVLWGHNKDTGVLWGEILKDRANSSLNPDFHWKAVFGMLKNSGMEGELGYNSVTGMINPAKLNSLISLAESGDESALAKVKAINGALSIGNLKLSASTVAKIKALH